MVRSLSIILLLAVVLAGCSENSSQQEGMSVASALGGAVQDGFARADKPREFLFPQDHGPHPEYRNEWWYFTGHLQAEDGRHFGYQVTFFRVGLKPPAEQEQDSTWSQNVVWMAHVALTDIQQQQHYFAEKLARDGVGHAGVSTQPLSVWLDNWQLDYDAMQDQWFLDVATDNFSFSLALNSQKPPVLQGDKGLSQKSPKVGNASYYYSLTRMAAVGEVTVNGEELAVTGTSWLDREWSTSALDDDQVGWDWFSLQLDRGQDLMFYQLRKQDGSQHPSSKGVWVAVDGSSELISAEQLTLIPQRFYEHKEGRAYPVEWLLEYAGKQWRINAEVDAQVMETTITYWEGAVSVTDIDTNRRIGSGYLEMTGY